MGEFLCECFELPSVILLQLGFKGFQPGVTAEGSPAKDRLTV